jgi:hypothetical protein
LDDLQMETCLRIGHLVKQELKHGIISTMAEKTVDYEIADINLAGLGAQRIAWAAKEMPVLLKIRSRITEFLFMQ